MTSEETFSRLPSNPLVLVPDGKVFLRSCSNLDSIIDLCFGSALCHAIKNASTSCSIRPRPVSWLSLDLNPRQKIDVSAVILPLLQQKCSTPRGTGHLPPWKILRDRNQSCFVETAISTEKWKLQQLRNLRVIIGVPWPDVLEGNLTSTSTKCPKSETHFRTTRYGKRTMSCHTIDLSIYVKNGVKVFILPELFQEATGDIFMSLLLSTLREFSEADNMVFTNFWPKLARHLGQPSLPLTWNLLLNAGFSDHLKTLVYGLKQSAIVGGVLSSNPQTCHWCLEGGIAERSRPPQSGGRKNKSV
ncbi:unnamed protein product [Schistocephalus solidus]|uniref:S-adenosyl-L-methionine-dependent methyltransferase superfamily protein n=1 Tax=Schistocephalus solidus TaxID=70667 RepID=A0A183TPR4_SCHSO|nr:unnamed protein product [Schistocephalus solidus]